ALWTATQSLLQWAAQGLGTPLPPRQQALTPDSLLGGRHVIAIVTHSAYFSLRSMWLFLMMLFLFRLLLHNPTLAALAFAAAWTAAIVWGPPSLFAWGRSVANYLIFAGLLSRFGLVAAFAAWMTAALIGRLPVTSHLTAWYAGGGLVGVAAVLALAAYG